MHKSCVFRLLTASAAAALSVPAALAASPFVEPDVQVLNTLTAPAGEGFGWVAERIGDINGDGAPEYLISSYPGDASGLYPGKVRVFDGRTGAVIRTYTGGAFQRLGFSVTGGQDVDGDGVPDYAYSAPSFRFTGELGHVYVRSGRTHEILLDITREAGDLIGQDIAFAGDVDHDGHADLIIGAYTPPSQALFGAGRVYLVSGRDGSTIWSHDGTVPGGLLGSGVTGLQDLNGDGVPEQAVGAFGEGHGGLAYILNGADGTTIRTLKPNGTAGAFGQFFVQDPGDVDGDGVGDVLVGDYADVRLGGSGRAYVFSGATDDRLRLVNGETGTDHLGEVRGAGDVDGDADADLLVGAYTSSAGGPTAGKCYLISGKNGHVLRTFTATLPGASIGFDVVTLEDVNGDGLGDYLLTGVDVAYVVAGRPISGPGKKALSSSADDGVDPRPCASFVSADVDSGSPEGDPVCH